MIIKDLQADHHIFPEEQRTPPLFSVPGSITASLGLSIEALPHLFGSGRTEGHGYMQTKWRMPVNLLNQLQPAVNIATTVAKNWRMDDVSADDDKFPGCLISARAIIHGTTRSYEFAVELYQKMATIRPEGWERSEVRFEVMKRYQAALPTQAVTCTDHPTIEGALLRMIGFQPVNLVKTGLVDKRRALDLLSGRSLWRPDEIDDVFLPALYDAACKLHEAIPFSLDYDDDHLDAIADLSPALAATAWQLWPSLRNNIEIASPWFSVHRPD